MTEKHVRYVEDVDSLAAAWTFVMEHVDEFTAPTIGIEAWTRLEYTYDSSIEARPETTGWTASIHGTVNA